MRKPKTKARSKSNARTSRNQHQMTNLALPDIRTDRSKDHSASAQRKVLTVIDSSFNVSNSAASTNSTRHADDLSFVDSNQRHATSLSAKSCRNSAFEKKMVRLENEFVDGSVSADSDASAAAEHSACKSESSSEGSSRGKEFQIRFVGSLYVDVDPEVIKRIEREHEIKKEKKRLLRLEKERQN